MKWLLFFWIIKFWSSIDWNKTAENGSVWNSYSVVGIVKALFRFLLPHGIWIPDPVTAGLSRCSVSLCKNVMCLVEVFNWKLPPSFLGDVDNHWQTHRDTERFTWSLTVQTLCDRICTLDFFHRIKWLSLFLFIYLYIHPSIHFPLLTHVILAIHFFVLWDKVSGSAS